MNQDEKIVKLKLDVIFRRVFGNEEHQNIIAAFLSDLLEIPRQSIRRVYVSDAGTAPEYLEQKFSRLDLKLDVDGRIVNVGLQVNREPNFKERTLFYWSGLFSGELKAGDEYGDLKQTICINIINFHLFDCEDYHSAFRLLEQERHELLTDKLAIHFFELRKLAKYPKKRRMEDWLSLIDAETEGDLTALRNTTEIPEVKDAVAVLRELNADEKVRTEAYYREKRLLDETTALGTAWREGIAEGFAKGEASGIAKGIAQGMTQKAKEIAETMRKNGLSEEMIQQILGEAYKDES